jgi:glycosyltransferase involved in cell wall biosynthesis
MPTPAVSVLIGAWNNAATLPRAIESILEQTLSDLELIVVDDGSTDETPEVVGRYSDPRLRRLELEHMGISRSLNHGLEEARAPIVAIEDADDWSLPTRLERQLEAMERSPEAAVVGCWMDEVDEAGQPLRPRQPRRSGSVRGALFRYNPIPGTASMLRRNPALAAGGFDPSFRYSADYDLWSRLAAGHDIICLPEVLAVRRMSSKAAGSRHERAQIREGIRIRWRLAQRRRRPDAAVFILKPLVSLVAPRPVKTAVRRLRGVAP